METFNYVEFEDGYGTLANLSFSHLYIWDENNKEYLHNESILAYAQKMYDKCKDNIFSKFLRKLCDYDENISVDVLITDKQVIVTAYSDYGHGQFPMQFNVGFNKHGDISIHLA